MPDDNSLERLLAQQAGIPATAAAQIANRVVRLGADGKLDDASRAAVQTARPITLPSRAAKLIQAPVFISGGRAVVGRTPKSYVPLDPRVEATQYYVDITNGNDANNGSTWALAFKSIYKATQAGNTAAVPYAVNIAAGTYYRLNGFSNNGTTVTPTQSCVFRAVGGQVVCINGDAHTFTLTSGTTYQVARSNVKRVFDTLNVDADGDFIELPLVADLATCRATPGSWYTDNVTLYINRADGEAVTSSNVMVLLKTTNSIKATTSGNMHLYGVTQYGGDSGCIVISQNAAGKFYGEDCIFKFSSNNAYADNVTALDYELIVMNRCVAAKGQKDGFNYHASGGSIPQAIHFDCIGYGNGTAIASTSNNGATTHDAGLLIDFNGRYFNNYGGDFAHANAGTMAVGVCVHTFGSYGDIARGGVALPEVGFHSVNGADIVKFDCVGSDQITGSGGSITVS